MAPAMQLARYCSPSSVALVFDVAGRRHQLLGFSAIAFAQRVGGRLTPERVPVFASMANICPAN